MAQEIELKLLLPGLSGAQALQALRRTPVLARRPLQQVQLWNRYYDTPDHALRQQSAALRLRRVQSSGSGQAVRTQWLQTLKTAGSGSALSQRGEWEQAVRSGRPDAQALPEGPWQALDPTGTVWPALVLCFETRCQRTLWRVRPRAGVLIEVALDVGTVRAQGRSVPLVELELELLQGPAEALFDLAQALGQTLPLLPSPVSKAERGYALASGQAAAPHKARPPALCKADAPAQVAPLLLDEVLNQLLRNLDGLRQGDAPEWTHQARVAWRRWRSLVRLLGPWLPALPAQRSALQPLWQDLGALRDLDVCLHDTLPRWLDAYQQAAPSPTQQAQRARDARRALRRLQQARQAARAAARQALCQPGTGQALLALLAWWQGLPAAMAAQPPEALRDWALPRLERWHRRLLRQVQASTAPGGNPLGLHAARLLAKRLRYAAEAVASGLPAKAGKRVRAWAGEGLAWQTHIGTLRDLDQCAQLLQAHGAAPALVGFVQGVALGWDQAGRT